MSEKKIHSDSLSKIGKLKKFLATLFTGMAAIAPVLGTVLLVIYLYKGCLFVGEKILVAGFFGLLNTLRGEEGHLHPWEFKFPGDELVLLAFPIVLFFAIGWGVKNRFGAFILSWIDEFMVKMPLLGFVYGALKQFVDAVRNLGGGPRKFKSVAYVEYPSEGCRLLGFVTGGYFDETQGKEVTTIFVPTSPNPATGFVIVVDDEKVMHSSLSLEEAGKLILSAGLVNPSEEGSSNN